MDTAHFDEVLVMTFLNSLNGIACEVNCTNGNLDLVSKHLEILQQAAEASISLNDLGLTSINHDTIASIITKSKLNSILEQ